MKHCTGLLIVLFALTTFLAACDSPESADRTVEDEPTTIAADDDQAQETEAEEPGELVLMARELGPLNDLLRNNPDDLDAWLAERDLTEEEVEDLLFQIAQDPEASRVYAESR